MKIRKKLIILITIIISIGINTKSYGKYVFEYIERAAYINIDKTPPVLQVEYEKMENKNVTVKIIANEDIQEVEGWQLLEDRRTLVKEYENNVGQVIIVRDISGNPSRARILIEDIDKKPPIVELLEISNTNTGYEKYANKTHEITIKLKISDTNKIINNLKEFIILVNSEKKTYNQKIIEEKENYIIYLIKMKNITGNGQLEFKIQEDSFEDIIGNKMSAKTLDIGIEIDNISPEVKFYSEDLSDGKKLAKIMSNEKIREMNGWQLDETQKINSKEFISDIKYQRTVKDLAGNESNIVKVEVSNATFLGFQYMAHISESGWVKAENNYVGTMKRGNIFKLESLAFRTSDKVDNDFLKVSAFAYTHWGPGTSAKSMITGKEYNYGYNPINGFATMKNTELVKIKQEQYIQLGGEGINGMRLTDINGNNPIPDELAFQYVYGMSGIKLDLKDKSENSIIYQIFFNDTGWLKICKNGELAMRATNKPIEAMKIAVVPTSELEFVENQWNKTIGTYNLE